MQKSSTSLHWISRAQATCNPTANNPTTASNKTPPTPPDIFISYPVLLFYLLFYCFIILLFYFRFLCMEFRNSVQSHSLRYHPKKWSVHIIYIYIYIAKGRGWAGGGLGGGLAGGWRRVGGWGE